MFGEVCSAVSECLVAANSKRSPLHTLCERGEPDLDIKQVVRAQVQMTSKFEHDELSPLCNSRSPKAGPLRGNPLGISFPRDQLAFRSEGRTRYLIRTAARPVDVGLNGDHGSRHEHRECVLWS